MANPFGMALPDERGLQEKDQTCVYCHRAMKTFPEIKAGRGVRADFATIEHLNFDEPFYVKDGLQVEDIVTCCAACDSSRARPAALGFGSSRRTACGRNINPNTRG